MPPLAAQNGWDEIAAKLLRAKKIQVNFKDLHANTALHLAAQNGQIKVAQHLIDAGADVNAPNAHKHIPLHLAAQNGHLALSKLLVESGTNLDYKDLIGKISKIVLKSSQMSPMILKIDKYFSSAKNR